MKKYMSNCNKHILVLGSARSGTSWFSENLAKPFLYRMLFEPEHDERTLNGHLLTDRMFTKDNPAPNEAMNYLNKVLQNRVDCNWIAQNSNRKYKMHLWPFIPKMFIIKSIRLNLSCEFLSAQLAIPIVFIIRDPFEVIYSQKRVNFPWLYDFSYFLNQSHLVDLIKAEFNYDLVEINTKSNTEKLAVRWCIENVIPLQIRKRPSQNFHLIKHEDLRADINLYKNLCLTLNLTVLENIEEEYKKPSTKTHPKSKVRGQTDKRIFIDIEDEAIVKQILIQFKQDLYDVD
jgi:hypothetical protein